ncbi:polyphosphate polymerase domain-containing protein [Actinoplanes sp. NPDC051851]|uniref:polyphosphate polymerase domain-containing protein n=1 Tax=Actinoplanes sp. NPDC051851 TaxID=3154753 RepID=UPI0034411D0E
MSVATHLDPISLTELTEKAALQTRVDRKYVLRWDDAMALLPALDRTTRVLEIDGERNFRYRSVYFDTPDLVCFRLTAHRRRRRFKVRTRTYLDSALCWLEVKTEGFRGGTVKNRLPYEVGDFETVAPGRWFVEEILGDRAVVELAPVLVSEYRRTTFYLPDGDSRVTLDTELSWNGVDGDVLTPRNLAIIETKTASAASPVDRLLWARGHRPTAISKYATGLSALRPELSAPRWRRTLRTHFW